MSRLIFGLADQVFPCGAYIAFLLLSKQEKIETTLTAASPGLLVVSKHVNKRKVVCVVLTQDTNKAVSGTPYRKFH